jgi:transposase
VLDWHVRALVDAHLAVIASLEEQMAELEGELRRLARGDRRLTALQAIYGVGPLVACHLLAEIGEARRFRRAEHLRWALVQAAQQAARRPDRSPDGERYLAAKERVGAQRATLSVVRKIAKGQVLVCGVTRSSAQTEVFALWARCSGGEQGFCTPWAG